MTPWLRMRLPLDGLGLGRSDALALRRWGRARLRDRLRRRGRAGWLLAGLLPLLSPLLWAVAVPVLVAGFLRRRSLLSPLPGPQAARLLADCWASGADPLECWLWRHWFSEHSHSEHPHHPLPGRAAALVLPYLGAAADHQTLRDKQAMADRLAAAGVPVPPTLGLLSGGVLSGGLLSAGLLPAGHPADPAALPPVLRAEGPARLFVKPRHGSGGVAAWPLDRLGPGLVRLNGRPPAPAAEALGRLSARLGDDLLIQPRLTAAPDLAALCAAGPEDGVPEDGGLPVLRLTTARLPGQAPWLHSALLCLPVPGQPPRSFLRGHLYVPVDLGPSPGADQSIHRVVPPGIHPVMNTLIHTVIPGGPASGTLLPGLLLGQPQQRLEQVPWNGQPLAGQPLPHLEAAASAALRAMALLPGLPLVNWDIALTADGPLVLDGNTCGNWILTALPPPGADTLLPLLLRWASAQA